MNGKEKTLEECLRQRRNSRGTAQSSINSRRWRGGADSWIIGGHVFGREWQPQTDDREHGVSAKEPGALLCR